MEIDKTNRNNLKGYFQRGKIPTEQNFAEFIDAMLNQAEDGLVKKPNEAVSLQAQKEADNVLKLFSFYKDFANETPALSLSLNAKNDKKLVDGFAVSNQAQTLLFIDEKTGNLGVGTVTPKAILDVNGSVEIKADAQIHFADNGQISSLDNNHRILFRRSENTMELREYGRIVFSPGSTDGKETAKFAIEADGALTLNGSFGNFTDADKDEWPNVTWYRDTAKNWDEGLIKHDSGKGAFKRAGFGIHMHQSREFGFWSTGWDALFAVEGGSGNTKVKGTLNVGQAIYAENSDMYFTKTDHTHTGFGNTTGYAAIENATNFGALMILGRQTKDGRIVKLWDFLQVNGTLETNGYILEHNVVYFSAYVLDNNLSGDKDVLPLKAVSQNVGNGFNANNSKFTAPVNGIYSFTMNAFKADAGLLHWYLLKNGDYANSGGNTNNENAERCLVTMNDIGHYVSRTIYVALNAKDNICIRQAGTGRVDNFRSGLEGCLIHALA